MIVDTHGHINFNAYKNDADKVIKRAFDNDVAIIAPGSEIRTSRRGVEYAERYNSSMLWAAVGIHPIHVADVVKDKSELDNAPSYEVKPEEFNRNEYEKLLKSDKVVAVGEIGLDYWRLPAASSPAQVGLPKDKSKQSEFKQKQKDTLKAQLDMAYENNLPVILHCRVAFDDMYEILKDHPITKSAESPGVIHSFTGDEKDLKRFLDLGYYVGITGIIFKLPWMPSIVREASLEKILLETDAPYLTPPKIKPEEGEEFARNEPAYVKHIATQVAKLKKLPVEKVEQQTTKNAEELFKIKVKK